VLTADPDDGDAWVAALVAADLQRDAAAFERALLFAQVLERRLGDAAAAAWLKAHGPLPSPTDRLERAVAER
jgi:sugar/nucleoside kinase (ribokinase family)